jgi:hypothetical protein
MVVTGITLPNLSEDPVWQILQQEFIALLDDLTGDLNYIDRVLIIKALLSHPECLHVEQLYFIPQTPVLLA